MAEIKFNLKTWQKHLGQIKFDKAAERGLLSGAMRAIPVLHRATDTAPPASDSPKSTRGANNTGKFRASWKSARIPLGISIHNVAPYAPVVEGGRRKGAKMPPVKDLAIWIQRRAGLSKKEAQGAAYAIALAIKKRGLKARNILKNSLPRIQRLMLKEVLHEMRVELKK